MSTTPDDEILDISSIFIGTFNANGSQLSQADCQKWLTQASDADLVILSFQECGTCCQDGGSHPPKKMSLHDYCRYPRHDEISEDQKIRENCKRKREDDDETKNDNSFDEQEKELLQNIKSSLSSHHYQVADVAMGEPPSDHKIQLKNGKSTQWYGYIRLILYVKGEATSSKIKQDIIPIVCPVGNKQSSYPNHYQPNSSPDKGAVCLAIPSLSIIICSTHLAGTNKYNTPEQIFDDIRIKQLQAIDEKCELELGLDLFQRLCPVVVGDLNFRCEVFSGENDKSKGGKDFCAVQEIVTSGDAEEVKKLFLGNDRLCSHLGHTHQEKRKGQDNAINNDENEGEALPLKKLNLTRDVVDLFWRESFSNETKKSSANSKVILPTFTFKVDDAPPRSYANKRTPSWTDRVLVSQRLLSDSGKEEDECKSIGVNKDTPAANNEGKDSTLVGSGVVSVVGTNDDIVSSDHIPVYCYINFK